LRRPRAEIAGWAWAVLDGAGRSVITVQRDEAVEGVFLAEAEDTGEEPGRGGHIRHGQRDG
jgi:hypothetical protein